ncbi:hypothetical protein ES708_21446 [subsurface metagenome]
MELKGIVFQCVPDTIFDEQPFSGQLIHFLGKIHIAVAELLGFIHGHIRTADQRGRIVAISRYHGNAYTDTQVDLGNRLVFLY